MANYEKPLVHGLDNDGDLVPLKVGNDGTLAISTTITTPQEFNIANLTSPGNFFSIDVSQYSNLTVTLVLSSYGGSFIFEASNNNSDWSQLEARVTRANTVLYLTDPITLTSAGGIYTFALPVFTKYIRMRLISYSNGSLSGSGILYQLRKDTGGVNVTGSSISVAPKSQTYVTGTIATSGDNTIIAAPGATSRLYITAITIQLEGSTATTVLFKRASTTFRRILCQNQGDGISLQYAAGFELRLGLNEAFILNLSGSNSIGYSVEYYIST